MKYLIILIFIVFLYWCWKNKIHINFLSFFKKGFHKHEDDFGLYCYTSTQGGGKTYSICDICDNYFKGKIFISNIESFCKYRINYSIYMNDFNEIVDFIDSQKDPTKFVIVFDEIFASMGVGGGTSKLTKKSRRFLSQLRKRSLHVLTSCQDWGELPRGYRKLCRYQIECSMFNFLSFGFAICINAINSGYDVKWDNDLQDFVAPRIKTTIKKASLTTASSYDTYEVIINNGSSLSC